MTTQDSRLRALERHAGRKGRDVTDDPRAALRRRLDQLAARRGPCDEQDLDDVREGLNARWGIHVWRSKEGQHMAALHTRIDRLERAHPQRVVPHPSDGDGAAVAQRLLDGTRIEDVSDRALLTVIDYLNACDRGWASVPPVPGDTDGKEGRG